jgi:hypothetical protein
MPSTKATSKLQLVTVPLCCTDRRTNSCALAAQPALLRAAWPAGCLLLCLAQLQALYSLGFRAFEKTVYSCHRLAHRVKARQCCQPAAMSALTRNGMQTGCL